VIIPLYLINLIPASKTMTHSFFVLNSSLTQSSSLNSLKTYSSIVPLFPFLFASSLTTHASLNYSFLYSWLWTLSISNLSPLLVNTSFNLYSKNFTMFHWIMILMSCMLVKSFSFFLSFCFSIELRYHCKDYSFILTSYGSATFCSHMWQSFYSFDHSLFLYILDAFLQPWYLMF
jgi:hypothetical protein